MFAQFDFLAGEAQLFNMDQWDGYVAARSRITRFLQAAMPSNPIVLTGDIHSSWVHNLKADYADESSATSLAPSSSAPRLPPTFRRS